MVRIDAKHPLEMAAVKDQEPVQTLDSDRADEALGDRVRLQRSDGCPDDLDPFTSEDGVELARELAIAIADQEALPGCVYGAQTRFRLDAPVECPRIAQRDKG